MLDCASGTAYGARELLAAGARSVAGADLAIDAILTARALYRQPHLGILVGDSTRLPFPDGAFDVYVSFETIEHVDDDLAFVAEARRVVREGGVFLCSTPNRRLTNPGTTIAEHPFNPFHVREYRHDELARVLGSAFERIEWLGQTFFASAYTRILHALGARARPLAVRAHQVRKLAGAPFDTRTRHWPRPLTPPSEPEVLIAVCR